MKTPNNTFKKSASAGFTIVEVVMVGLLFGIVMYSAYIFLGTFKKQTLVTTDAIEQALDASLGDRILRQDVVEAGPSLNLLDLEDDNSNSFFDFISDSPCTSDCERLFSMRPSGEFNKSFYMVLNDPIIAPQMYHPPQAYEIVKPADPTLATAASITYRGINYQNYFLKILPHNDVRTSGFWQTQLTGRMLQFYSMVSLRPTSATGVVDMATIPRLLSYVGFLSYTHTGDWSVSAAPGGGLENMTLSGSVPTGVSISAVNPENRFNVSHPKNSSMVMNDSASSVGVNGFDRFLRTLPPLGGLEAVAFFRPIQYVKYYFTEDTVQGKTVSKLWKEEWDPETNSWLTARKLMVGQNLYGVVFKRRNVASPVIEITVARTEGHFTRARRLGITDEVAEAEAAAAEAAAP